MKDTFYFSHDYNAASDEKIVRLLSRHGMAGYGVFWRIVEMLYNNANELKTDYESINYELRASNIELIRSVINDFDLFIVEGDCFGSASIYQRLAERNEKSKKARQSVLKRWRKVKEDTTVTKTDTNVLENDTTVTKTDTIKESKGKDIKDSKETALPDEPAPSKTDFIDSIISAFIEVFPDYKIITPGKERTMAGKIAAQWKKDNPLYTSEQIIQSLREYFIRCKSIQDAWYRNNMSLTIMATKYNEINNNLKSGKKKSGSGPASIEIEGMDHSQ